MASKHFGKKRTAPSKQRDTAFALKFVECGSGLEAYRHIGLGTGNHSADHAGASRMLRSVRSEIERIQRRLEDSAIASLKEKQAMLSHIAFRNYDTTDGNELADPYMAIGAIRELNKMEGHYAPTKSQKTIGNFTFIQDFGSTDQSEEKSVEGEVVE